MPEANPTAGTIDFEAANRLFFRLYQCSNLMHKHGTRFVSAFSCTTQQWAVLGALARPQSLEKGMTVKDLIAFLMLSRQNLNLVLARLEERGWLDRVKDADDGRSRRIRLSENGIAAWAEMRRPIETFYGAGLSGFSPGDARRLTEMLDKLRDGLGAL